MTAATYVPYQMGLVSEAGPTAARAARRAGSPLPPPVGFTSLSTSFSQFREVCAATCDRMTNFTARGPLHLPTDLPGGGDGG